MPFLAMSVASVCISIRNKVWLHIYVCHTYCSSLLLALPSRKADKPDVFLSVCYVWMEANYDWSVARKLRYLARSSEKRLPIRIKAIQPFHEQRLEVVGS